MILFDAKFFQTIQTFSPAELKSFELWLKSPWANSNKNLIRLLEKVAKYHPDFDAPKLTKAKLFKQILPNGKFSDRRMNNLLSEGYLAAERFMVFNSLSNNQNLQKDLLTQELQNRHLEDWFFRDINKEVARLEGKEVKDWEDHLDLLRLNRRIYHHPNQNPRMQPGKQTIIKMGEQLDLVYLLEKAVIITEKIFRNRIYKNEDHDIEQEIKIWLTASKNVNHLAIELYRIRFKYTEKTMLEQYFELRGLFLERYPELNKKEQKIQLMSLLNDTVLLLKKSDSVDFSDSLLLYKVGLSTKIIFHQGVLNHINFRTIIIASNYLKSFDYTHNFIKSNVNNLDEKFQSDGLNWANAHTAYWELKLNKSLDILIRHKFKTSYFQLFSRFLTTQVYFDLYLNDFSYQLFLLDYLNSFEKWVAREKIGSKNYKKSFLNFIQKCRSIAKLYSEIELNLDKIDKILISENNLQGKRWLKRKKDKIMKKRFLS